jgi:hypothetical protein
VQVLVPEFITIVHGLELETVQEYELGATRSSILRLENSYSETEEYHLQHVILCSRVWVLLDISKIQLQRSTSKLSKYILRLGAENPTADAS